MSSWLGLLGKPPSGTPPRKSTPEDLPVPELEEDLLETFQALEKFEEAAKPLDQLRGSIKKVQRQQAIIKHGFMAAHHFEEEGADAVLFDDVPPWISYSRISGYRYRLVMKVADPDDEFELYNEGVAFYGVPGASGWADGIGDVAVHYMGARWAVFSKIFPFSEQGAAREAHEDVLLLGTAKHVMLTPHCAYRIGERATDRPTPPPARQHAPSHAHACPFPCP